MGHRRSVAQKDEEERRKVEVGEDKDPQCEDEEDEEVQQPETWILRRRTRRKAPVT